eukprot:3995295-Alexandrium_andersonii.AAC.1
MHWSQHHHALPRNSGSTVQKALLGLVLDGHCQGCADGEGTEACQRMNPMNAGGCGSAITAVGTACGIVVGIGCGVAP